MAAGKPKSSSKRYPMPFTRLEIVVMSLIDGVLQVLLARRAGAPYAGRWALPGGVLRIDVDQTLEQAARRVMMERLGIELPFLRQLCAVGGPRRDPRGPWALSIVYRALVPAETLKPTAGKRVEELTWRSVQDVGKDSGVAFDHADLIANAAEATRTEVENLDLPFGFLPDEFTLGELQSTCEEFLGRGLDKSSFRRRLAARDLVEPVKGEMRHGPFRPAKLYRRKP